MTDSCDAVTHGRASTERELRETVIMAGEILYRLGLVDYMGHTHQTLAPVFGLVGRPRLPILHVEAPLVADGVPIYDSPRLLTSAALGAEVADALGGRDVCHLRNRGIVAVGRTVQEATVNAIFLERLARANLLASQL